MADTISYLSFRDYSILLEVLQEHLDSGEFEKEQILNHIYYRLKKKDEQKHKIMSVFVETTRHEDCHIVFWRKENEPFMQPIQLYNGIIGDAGTPELLLEMVSDGNEEIVSYVIEYYL